MRRIRRPALLGLDLGASGIKMVRLEKRGEEIRLDRYLRYPEKVTESVSSSVEKFRKFLVSQGLSEMLAACSLSDPSLKVQRVDLPKMPDFDLREAVKWQLRDAVEGKIEHYGVRYTPMEEYQSGETSRIVLTAYIVRKEAVQRSANFLRRLSLIPELIEPTPVALLAAFDRLAPWGKGAVYGLLDLGESQSSFYAVSEGKIYLARPLVEVSGEFFNRMISQELSLEDDRARALKESFYLHGGEVAEEASKTLLQLFYSKIAMEAQRSVDAFAIQYRREKIDRIFLTGGGAALPGLSDYLTKNLGIRAVSWDPLEGMASDGTDHHLFAVATGLALYGL